MRLIGRLHNEAVARTFSDFLYVQGIESQIEAEADGSWEIWIHAEEEIERAKQFLAAFRENPGDPKFQRAGTEAARIREQKETELDEFQKKVRDGSQVFQPLAGYGLGPLTVVLIVISVVVFLFSNFGRDVPSILSLFITEYDVPGGPARRLLGLAEIRHGELWRIFTPMFVHFNVLHILFNMLWLRDLGCMIEVRQSSRQLAILVFAIAGVSNLAQLAVSGPRFGGMSGVVYGLLGYVWLRGKFDPGSGLFLHPTTMTMMVIWFFLCFTGWLGPIANTVHAVGFGMGIAWGYLSSFNRR